MGLAIDDLRRVLTDVVSGSRPHSDVVVSARDRFGREFSCALSCSVLADRRGDDQSAIVLMEESSEGASV